jgi:hypothetical protein
MQYVSLQKEDLYYREEVNKPSRRILLGQVLYNRTLSLGGRNPIGSYKSPRLSQLYTVCSISDNSCTTVR